MAYYEFLRVRHWLKVLAISLVAIFLVAVVLRVAHDRGNVGVVGDMGDFAGSTTAHITRVVLPNGTTQTTVDDPKKHFHAVFVTPAGHSGAIGFQNASLGIDAALFFSVSTLISLVIATVLAAVFSNQNRGHLEIAFMWPVSRERTALQAIAIDSAAIAISAILAALVSLAVTSLFVHVALLWTPSSGAFVALALVAPIAWYGLLLATSASLRSFGAVAGIGWAVAVLLPAFAQSPIQSDGNSTVAWVFAAVRVLAHLDPIAYLRVSSGTPHGGIAGSPEAALLFLTPLAIVYLAAAVLQWRRVEA